jgi:hypothetical protein
MDKDLFIKTDDNKVINEKYIRWVKKMNNCLEICTKSIGCAEKNGDTHNICELKSPDSYYKLNELFK